MTEYQPSNIRVSDTEREDALTKLGEHMSAGRLDIEEYGERTAKVATTKTRGELLGLFGDLPEPKPTFGVPVPSAATEPVRPKRSLGQRVAPVMVPVVCIAMVVGLIILIKLPFFVLFPFLFIAFGGGARWRGGGGGGRDHHRRMHRRWGDERG